MLSRDQFVAARSHDWRELDALLAPSRELGRESGPHIARVASLYRSLCSDLMRARTSRFGPDLTGYLNALAGRAHAALYAAKPLRMPALVRLFTTDFPQTLRKHGRFFALSCALFVVPLIIGLIGALGSDAFALAVLPAQTLEGMADAYSKGFEDGRGTGVDAGMAGFYVQHNVGIAFRCFATGILFGTGSLFFLVYNGLMIGTVTGYVAAAGHGANILTFMCGHAPFELTAIVVAGAAGLRMGYSLVDTQGLTRTGSLRREASDIATLVVGAAAMLVIAAFIEGFWSPSSIRAEVKWSFSAAMSVAVALYLAFAGRARGRA